MQPGFVFFFNLKSMKDLISACACRERVVRYRLPLKNVEEIKEELKTYFIFQFRMCNVIYVILVI